MGKDVKLQKEAKEQLDQQIINAKAALAEVQRQVRMNSMAS